ncbi:MAG: Cell shape-determining protein MreC [Alphaproteobacteria bacterium MarineAlpha5_Bin8]|nr:MAG: Cell shape-determining protein MreC [Alphaproteobacteria bacterium MarineAlpha5_Bin7]PPR48222.1 MAG: Cell shape-determining protein MreC [Alphaproteobacteria bacterium MarineAlpha5_Bin8]|tara:strand:- start:1411 stop:2232 length:822 start_codon:yes stop_codon:yes gene_type:complete
MLYRNKIKYFTKSKNIGSLSVSILFIITFLLVIFNKTDYFVVNKVKSLGIDIVSPVSKVISSPVIITSNVMKTINDFRLLKNENLRLKEEVLRLKKWQTLALKNISENKAYKKLLNATSNNLNIVKTATVIAQTSNIYSKAIVINAGLNNGVVVDQIVINEKGLVGKIIEVSKNNSKVLLINDQNFSISVKNIANNFQAIISGSSNDGYLKSSFIKNQKKPRVGEILITSGTAKIFPKDIAVGKIVMIKNEEVFALPFVDTQNLNFVQIIEIK